jgi:hypothetical protein
MLFGKKCPKCGGKNINTIKEGFGKSLLRNAQNLAFPVRILFSSNRKPKNLNVCKDCSFSWEDR